MAQQHIADIDPNDAMASLESDFVEQDATGAGTSDNATTTTATTSTEQAQAATVESPEALAARQAAEGEQARERETRNTNSRENSNSSNNSTTNSTLFDGAAAKPEGKVIEPADSDLVMIDGKLVPFGEVRGSTIFKPKYDQAVRERDALAAQAGEVDKRKQSIDAVEPFLRTLEKDVYGRTYIETLTLTGDPERARKAAEAAAGIESGIAGNAARQTQVDPRLVPPTDESGDALAEDDPRWIKWRTGPFNEATTEAATRKVLDEHQAKADREAKAQRDADNERTRTQQTADAAVQGRVQENLRVLSNLGPELIKRGVDVGAMTPAEWQNARNLFAETLRSHDKDVSDEYLRTKELTLGDVRAVIGSEGFLAKVQPAAKAAPATAAATANGTTNGAAGNNGAAGANAATGRPAMQNNYARQPLNAGGPSDAVAGADGGARSIANDEDATLQAMESLG